MPTSGRDRTSTLERITPASCHTTPTVPYINFNNKSLTHLYHLNTISQCSWLIVFKLGFYNNKVCSSAAVRGERGEGRGSDCVAERIDIELCFDSHPSLLLATRHCYQPTFSAICHLSLLLAALHCCKSPFTAVSHPSLLLATLHSC